MRSTAVHRQLGDGPQLLAGQLIDAAVANRIPEQSDLDWKRERYAQTRDWQEELART